MGYERREKGIEEERGETYDIGKFCDLLAHNLSILC